MRQTARDDDELAGLGIENAGDNRVAGGIRLDPASAGRDLIAEGSKAPRDGRRPKNRPRKHSRQRQRNPDSPRHPVCGLNIQN